MRTGGGTAFLAWTATSGRAQDVADALGGTAVLVHPRTPRLLRHPFSTALRYLLSTVATVRFLLCERPSCVVVTNPPLIPPLLVAVWSRLTGARFVMDSHPSAFGAKGKVVLARLQPVHRWLARQAAAVLVTTPERAAQVDGWGARGLVVHEPPVPFPAPERGGPPTVLFVGIFSSDEPVDAVVDAAALLPDVCFRITGDVRRAPAGLVHRSPENVEYVGYLTAPVFRAAVAGASLVLTLTTEPSSVMRSAYEAVYAHVPLVTTDTPALREAFPYAVFCDNSAPSVASAVAAALADLPRLRADAAPASALQRRRWDEQLAALRAACGLPPTGAPGR
jgi:glycosyltransferase involved in cell wall biosynthesis